MAYNPKNLLRLLYSLSTSAVNTLSTSPYPSSPGVSINSSVVYFQKWSDLPYLISPAPVGSTDALTFVAPVNGINRTFNIYAFSLDIYQYKDNYGKNQYRYFRIYSSDDGILYRRYYESNILNNCICTWVTQYRNANGKIKVVNLPPISSNQTPNTFWINSRNAYTTNANWSCKLGSTT